MIGSVVNFSGSYAFGGFGSTGLSGGGSAYAAGAGEPPARRLGAVIAGRQPRQRRADPGGADANCATRWPARATAPTPFPAAPRSRPSPPTSTHYVDKPTYVTVNGKPVQNGTVTVADGTQKIVTAFERVNRGRTDIGESLRVLLNATVAVGSAPGLSSENTFGSQIGAFLKSDALNTALSKPDKASLDGAIDQVDGLLAKAEGLGFTASHRAAAAAQVDLGGAVAGRCARACSALRRRRRAERRRRLSGGGESTDSTSSGSTVQTVA